MMTIEQAFSVLDQALNTASKAGAFGIQDAVIINNAIVTLKNELTPKPIQEEGVKEIGPAKKK